MFRRKPDAAPAAGPSKAQLTYARFQNSNKTFYGALVFFLLIMAGIVYIAVPWGSSSEPGVAVAAPTPAAVPAPVPGPDGAINGCLPQDAVEVPPEKVAGSEFETTWTATGQMSLPSSPTGGPGVMSPPRCFTRTPEGSLYSIATFVTEMAGTTSNAEKVDVITRRSLHDSNYGSYVQKLAADTPVTGEPMFRISGYRWQEYSPQRAVVEIQVTLLTGVSSTQTNSIMYGVIWANNDWLLIVPNPTSPVTLPDAQFRTFHPWGGTA